MSDIMLINLPTGTEKRGLNMAPPHGHLVFDGRKTVIAKAKPFDLSGPWILVSGGKAFGTIDVALPSVVGVKEFDDRFGQHRVSKKERERWWPDSKSLYLSEIVRFEHFEEPLAIKTYPGMQTVLEEVTFEDDEPTCLDEHCKAVRMLLDAGTEIESEEVPQPEAKEAATPVGDADDEEDTAMPYSIDNPPEKISHLPAKVQRQWVHVFNSCMEKYGDEGRCHQMANGVVKKAGHGKEDKGLAFSFKVLKAQDGRDWLVTYTTNAFEDRERETFRTKAIEAYVERHAADEVKGEYWFWHLPGMKFADILWQAVVGRFLVEAGPFDDTPMGQKMAAFFSQYPVSHPEIAPEGWGTSHGYYYVPHDRKDGIYDWFDKFETTVLPLSVASNQHSPRMEVLTKMNKQQADALEVIGTADLVAEVIATGEQRTAELEAKGVTFKSADAEADAPVEETPPEAASKDGEPEGKPQQLEATPDDDAEDVKGADIDPQAEGVKALAQQIIAGLDLGGLVTAVKQQQEVVSGFGEKLETLEKSLDERLKALEDIGGDDMSPLIPMPMATLFQASKLAQTETEEGSAEPTTTPTVPTAIAEAAKRLPM